MAGAGPTRETDASLLCTPHVRTMAAAVDPAHGSSLVGLYRRLQIDTLVNKADRWRTYRVVIHTYDRIISLLQDTALEDDVRAEKEQYMTLGSHNSAVDCVVMERLHYYAMWKVFVACNCVPRSVNFDPGLCVAKLGRVSDETRALAQAHRLCEAVPDIGELCKSQYTVRNIWPWVYKLTHWLTSAWGVMLDALHIREHILGSIRRKHEMDECVVCRKQVPVSVCRNNVCAHKVCALCTFACDHATLQRPPLQCPACSAEYSIGQALDLCACLQQLLDEVLEFVLTPPTATQRELNPALCATPVNDQGAVLQSDDPEAVLERLRVANLFDDRVTNTYTGRLRYCATAHFALRVPEGGCDPWNWLHRMMTGNVVPGDIAAYRVPLLTFAYLYDSDPGAFARLVVMDDLMGRALDTMSFAGALDDAVSAIQNEYDCARKLVADAVESAVCVYNAQVGAGGVVYEFSNGALRPVARLE